ncbi:S1/P1 nuclease [Leucosporidium creatinivorum]|uniref:S1/P1 nuclease n=1 Tax=Leucosporidium creatinivorum TaxID=106004 RepID=A0A1Y2FWD1_9BASI|nr:S1/P1 nuclease [Leucosporidium creatinivorum]
MHLLPLLLPLFALPTAYSWGAVGHEIVATIAQIHLHQPAQQALQHLLPNSKGHLAPIASWADRLRGLPYYSWSGELHYTSPLGDWPPSKCHFGDEGWKTTHDVLHAISNYTTRLSLDPSDVTSLKFLVHFIGDAHQPLHLTNRDRGGNDDRVRFEGRLMNLHSLWDGGFITKSVREQSNYTEALPSRQIESNLRGTIYDPYIRLLLWEGVRIWWRTSLPSWFICPSPLSLSSLSSSQLILSTAEDGEKLSSVVCPQTWAQETHKITCERTFPPSMGEEGEEHQVPELNTKEYYGPIRDGNIIEKLLVQGGLRLAATLNAIFEPEEDGEGVEGKGLLNFAWLEEAAAEGKQSERRVVELA